MTAQRIPAGLPTGGQFAASARGEVSLSLAPSPNDGPGDAGLDVMGDAARQTAVTEAVLGEVEGLISRATTGGTYTETARQDDVAHSVREHVPHLGDDDFEAHMARIARAAEIVSVIERADDTDTDVYEAYAAEGGLDVEDFPAGPDWEPGDGYHDLATYRDAALGHWEARVHESTRAMVTADAAAAQAGVLAAV